MRNIKEIAENLAFHSKLINVIAKQSDTGKGIRHCKWILLNISIGAVENDKAHRWLGYAQAVLVLNNYFTLEEMKELNK